jgi:hypothetical protein
VVPKWLKERIAKSKGTKNGDRDTKLSVVDQVENQ